MIWLRYAYNRQRHESSEQHQKNVDRYLSRQKVAKERAAAQEKEVDRIVKQAEDVRGCAFV